MSDPTRIKYRSCEQVPSTADLLTKVTRDRHLVLELPAGYNCQRIQMLIDRVAHEVPENYTAFYAGAFRDKTCVTIKQVVGRDTVIEMEEDLVEAAQHFRRTATGLAVALASYNQVAPGRLWEECRKLECHSAAWDLEVHGQHCRFENRKTGQIVEVSMWFGTEFGVLDPYFFFDYMRTTPCLAPPLELRDAFHDTRRAMEILEERGKLAKITGIFESVGLAALPDIDEGSQDMAPNQRERLL